MKKIPSSKLRKFYDYVNDIEVNKENEEWFVKFAFLKPKIAYNKGKERDGGVREALGYLHDLVDIAVREIDNSLKKNNRKEAIKKFNNFKKFFESVVAYHRTVSKN